MWSEVHWEPRAVMPPRDFYRCKRLFEEFGRLGGFACR